VQMVGVAVGVVAQRATGRLPGFGLMAQFVGNISITS
jgi:hypothetical protein